MLNKIILTALCFISSTLTGMQHPYQNMPYDPALFHAIIEAFENPADSLNDSPKGEQLNLFQQKNFSCTPCNKIYTSAHGFNIHLAIILAPYRFNCLKCGYRTNNSSNFKRHQRPLGISCGPKIIQELLKKHLS